MGEDKRRAPRIEFHLRVLIKGKEVPSKIMNFSKIGIFIQTNDPSQFKEGDEVDLVMKLPLEKRTTRVTGRVAHIKKEGVGVEFIRLRPQDVADIDYCFEVFKNTLPLPGT